MFRSNNPAVGRLVECSSGIGCCTVYLVPSFMMQVREAQLAQFNYILVVGEEEKSKKQVSPYPSLANFF
jgi:2-phosphoglycerate kinase